MSGQRVDDAALQASRGRRREWATALSGDAKRHRDLGTDAPRTRIGVAVAIGPHVAACSGDRLRAGCTASARLGTGSVRRSNGARGVLSGSS